MIFQSIEPAPGAPGKACTRAGEMALGFRCRCACRTVDSSSSRRIQLNAKTIPRPAFHGTYGRTQASISGAARVRHSADQQASLACPMRRSPVEESRAIAELPSLPTQARCAHLVLADPRSRGGHADCLSSSQSGLQKPSGERRTT
jgi:hypothetical protein